MCRSPWTNTPTCLTCQKSGTPEQPALSQEQVQITFATQLANADVSVYTLMKLLGHESMVTSQRYVTAAGTETRTAAAQNKLYGLFEQALTAAASMAASAVTVVGR